MGFVFCQSASDSQAAITVTQSSCSHVVIMQSSCSFTLTLHGTADDAVTDCCKATSISSYIAHFDPGSVLESSLKSCSLKCADS